jgi:hypothetical protein
MRSLLLVESFDLRFSSSSDCYVDRPGFVAFHSPFFLNQFWIASMSVCSFCKAMAGSLSMATSALSSERFAVIDSGDVGRSEVYSRYKNGPRTLP